VQQRWAFVDVFNAVQLLIMKLEKRLHLAFAALALLFVGGCRAESPKTSDNIAVLNEIIDIQFSVKSGRWEAFSTPEGAGFLTAPADYITLIAELKPANESSNAAKEATGEIYIVPEASRPWLSGDFRQFLDKNKNKTVNVSSQADCRKYVTTLKKSHRTASGFACTKSGRVLLYLTIASAKEIEASLPK